MIRLKLWNGFRRSNINEKHIKTGKRKLKLFRKDMNRRTDGKEYKTLKMKKNRSKFQKCGNDQKIAGKEERFCVYCKVRKEKELRSIRKWELDYEIKEIRNLKK